MADSEEKEEKKLKRRLTMSSVEDEILRSSIGRKLVKGRMGRFMTDGNLSRFLRCLALQPPYYLACQNAFNMNNDFQRAQSMLPADFQPISTTESRSPWRHSYVYARRRLPDIAKMAINIVVQGHTEHLGTGKKAALAGRTSLKQLGTRMSL